MEVKILKEDKDLLELEITGENNTLCNILRNELNTLEDVSFASYNIKHPLISNPVFAIKSKKGKPKKLVLDAVESLKTRTKEMRSLLVKLE